MELAHYTYDGKCISLPLMYCVDSLLTRTRLVRWSEILLRQFCFSLDCCRSFINGRLHFPFDSGLYTLFFERFHFTRSTFIHGLPPRPRTITHMHMWGQLFPKRGQSEWSCSVVEKGICELLASIDERDVVDLVLYLYAKMDWRGCMNIHFTEDKPPNDRGNIIVMF